MDPSWGRVGGCYILEVMLPWKPRAQSYSPFSAAHPSDISRWMSASIQTVASGRGQRNAAGSPASYFNIALEGRVHSSFQTKNKLL